MGLVNPTNLWGRDDFMRCMRQKYLHLWLWSKNGGTMARVPPSGPPRDRGMWGFSGYRKCATGSPHGGRQMSAPLIGAGAVMPTLVVERHGCSSASSAVGCDGRASPCLPSSLASV
jgi:hypothetical protein